MSLSGILENWLFIADHAQAFIESLTLYETVLYAKFYLKYLSGPTHFQIQYFEFIKIDTLASNRVFDYMYGL